MGSNKPSAAELTWIRQQVEHPAPFYSVSQLARLCGPNVSHRWLRKTLRQKKVIKPNSKQGRDHIVEMSLLDALWPECWRSVVKALGKSGKLDVPTDLDPTG